MDSLPIPHLRSSWIASFINTSILFLLYYLFTFNVLLEVYKGQFAAGYFKQSVSQQLEVSIDYPRYFYAAGPATVFIHVRNLDSRPIEDVKVFLLSQSIGNTLLLPRLHNEDVYSSGVEFAIIEPKSIVTGRVSFITQSNSTITSVLVEKEGNNPELLHARPEIRFAKSNPKALQLSFLETILLPPWSNGYILALVLLSAYLVRSNDELEPSPIFHPSFYTSNDSDKNSRINAVFNLKWWLFFKQDYIRSSIILIVMILMTISIYFFLDVLHYVVYFFDIVKGAIFGFAGLTLFSILIYRVRLFDMKKIKPYVVFLGFAFMVLGIAVILTNLFTWKFFPLWEKIVWILLVLEGAVAFFMFYPQELMIGDKNSDDGSHNLPVSHTKPNKNKKLPKI